MIFVHLYYNSSVLNSVREREQRVDICASRRRLGQLIVSLLSINKVRLHYGRPTPISHVVYGRKGDDWRALVAEGGDLLASTF